MSVKGRELVLCKLHAPFASLTRFLHCQLDFSLLLKATVKQRIEPAQSARRGGTTSALPEKLLCSRLLLILVAPDTALTSVVPLVPEPEPAASAEDLIAQGKALAAQQQYSAALPYFERATQLAPRSFTAWFHLGFTRNHLNEWQGGYDAYEHAVALDPNAAIAWNNLGNALDGLARYDEALAAYERAVALDPDFAIAWNHVGNARFHLAQYEEALAAYERAVTLDPGFLTAWENKGDSLSALGRYREALAAYEYVLHLAPERLSALAGTAGILSLLGEHDRALSVYARHEALAPLEVRSYITKGAELWSVRRYDEARVAFEAAVAAGGDTPLWTNLGLALAKVKRREEALAAFDRALTLDPHYVDAAVQRARTLLRLRRFKEGRAAVTHAADLRVEQRHARHPHAHE